ncbi:MAG: LysR family transcriptional regulator [Alphaproteobacteria bacterium]|nr:LysR family transcriptional regulator [Alphaproteobacteria bacterium]
MRNQMRQRNLQAFRVVCETGSITRTAERLGLSQPAVSQIIARFEDAFALRLFVHGMGRRLRPTPSARVLYVDVCRTLDAMAGIEATARLLADGETEEGGPAGAPEGGGLAPVPGRSERRDIAMKEIRT